MKPKKPTKPPDTETSSILSELEGELSPATLDALAQVESAYGFEKPATNDAHPEITVAMKPMAYPDIKTLSMLAAIVSQGTTKTPSEAVHYAWKLWEESKEVLQYGGPFVRDLRKPDPKEQHWKQTGRFPKRFPVKLDDFLRLMLPHLSGRTAEKFGIFREYLKFRLRNPSRPPFVKAHDRHGPMEGTTFDCLNPRVVPPTEGLLLGYSAEKPDKPATPPEPTKDDVDKRFALWQANPIPDRDSFYYHAGCFRSWYETTHSAEISAKRRASGAKGLAKKREKNKSHADSSNADKRKGARPPIDRLRQALQAQGGGLDTIPSPKKP